MNKVIIVTGPTGIGKSNLGIEICQKIGSEIVSCDSIQIYKELDIGSAKTTESELAGIKQHMVNIVEPYQDYSVYQFQREARAKIAEICDRGLVPVVVGGTGLYLKALIYDYEFTTIDKQDTIKMAYDKLSNEELYERLKSVDETFALKVHPNNRKRVIRALMIAESGETKSSIEERQAHSLVYDCFFVECTAERSSIEERANLRVEKMVDAGLEEEVCNLVKKYPEIWDKQSMQGIGYREWREYFLGNKTRSETIEEIKRDTRHLIKKQYTWIRHQLPQMWVNVSNPEERESIINEIEEWTKRCGTKETKK